MAKHYFKKTLPLTLILLLFLASTNSTVVYAQWTINEGFEGGSIPAGWTIYDVNNDGEQWGTLQHAYAHSGNWLATVQCFGSNGEDWLITPQVTINNGDVFTFFARAWYGTENMKVRLSTTGKQINNFNVTLENVNGLGNSYQEFTYDLSAYQGQQIYLAIQWLQNTYSLVVDDIKVGQPQASDVGILSIDSPLNFHLLDAEVIPSCTIKNFGNSDVTEDFPVICTITNQANGTVVYTQTISYTNTLAASQTEQLLFPVWQPSDSGTYLVNMSTNLSGDGDPSNDALESTTEIVIHYGTGGPDLMGYRWIDSHEPDGPVYDWIEISNTGMSVVTYGVNAFAGDDNFSEPMPLGFDFPFYGINRTYFHADINGELLLAENIWYKPFPGSKWNNDGNIFNYYAPIPGYTEMPALIAVFWDDLFAEENTGDIYYQMFGSAPERYGVIQWNNLRFSAGNGGSQTLCFEVILHENGDIIMQYKNVDNGQSGSTLPHVFGQSATIAIQNDDATAGLSYLREIIENNQYVGPEPPGNLPQNNLAIKFYMGEDLEPPLISHKQVWNTFNDYMELSATITDVSGILSDTLYYNTGNGWQGITHISFEEPNIYEYLIEDIPAGASVEYYFVATDNSPNANRAELHETQGEPLEFNTLPTAGVNILLAMPGNKPGFQDYQNKEYPKYVAALNAQGVSYDVFNWAAYEQFSFPDSYDIIIAYSNSTRNSAIHDTLSNALINFMDSGTEASPKNVFMASDNLPSVQHALPNARPLTKFFTAYLRGGYNPQPNPPIFGGPDGIAGPDSLGYFQGSIKGLPLSPIGTENQIIPVFSDDPDVIYNRECPDWYADEVNNPEISSWGSYIFEDGPFDGNAYSKGHPCAIWLDNLIYKSYFISFDISQLTNDSDINNMIAEALEWFTPETYTITATASPSEGGSVAGAGTYAYNQTATLLATPAEGYQFVNWTENGDVVSTDAQYSFNVTSDRTLVAHFETQTFTITATASPAEGGSVTGAGTYTYNQTVTLNATPAEGYQFINWTENGEVVSTDAQYSFNVISDRTLVANFATETFVITATAAPVEGGSITGAGNYVYNQTATLIATPAEGYQFINWTENGDVVSTDAQYSFTVTSDRTLVANFATLTFVITATAAPVEGGTVTGAGTYTYNQTATLNATPSEGYQFVNWTEDGDVVSTDEEYSFAVTSDRTLVANFEKQTFTITATASPDEGGTVTGAGTYTYNQTATLNATPSKNYEFMNWTENGDVVSINAEYTFTVTSDRMLVANFDLVEGINAVDPANLSIFPNPAKDVLFVKVNDFPNRNAMIQIHNSTGQRVLSNRMVIQSEVLSLDISALKAGLYYVLMQMENKTISKKIVIQ
ncbi:MAG: choice-of-anchor J domain-containing protein [Lentimicrobiaceae bacterium]|nr:choice-of-anchor J domain-containing protein [Lentimicrobiaceae bacterium]